MLYFGEPCCVSYNLYTPWYCLTTSTLTYFSSSTSMLSLRGISLHSPPLFQPRTLTWLNIVLIQHQAYNVHTVLRRPYSQILVPQLRCCPSEACTHISLPSPTQDTDLVKQIVLIVLLCSSYQWPGVHTVLRRQYMFNFNEHVLIYPSPPSHPHPEHWPG